MALEFNNDNYVPRIPHTDMGNGGNENSENYDSNYAIAQEISSRIGVEPIPFNSVYDIALAIYRELGGEDEGFDSVYSILLEILPLVEGGGGKEPMQEVTYAELKALRDNSQLVPGQQYRITDYVTTNPKKDTIILQILNDEHKPSLYVRYPEGDTDGYFAFTCIKNTYDNGTYINDMSIDINDTWGDESVVLFTTENPGLGNSDVKADMNYFDVSEKYVRSRQAVQSEEHPFDIIVTADAKDKLNENARAIQNESTLGFAAIQVTDEEEVNTFVCKRYPEGDYTEGSTIYYAWAEVTDSMDYTIEEVENWSDITTSHNYLIFSETENISVDTPLLINRGEGTQIQGQVTEYESNVKTSYYFDNSKLESWELKYCLDNDTDRFSWAAASEGNEGLGFAAISVHADDEAHATLFKRYPEMDIDMYCAWMHVNNSDDLDINSPLVDWTNIGNSREECVFTSSEIPSFGVTMYYLNGDERIVADSRWLAEYSKNVQYVEQGKGVIYSMKDEFNNQAYFDYKNIKIFDENYGDYCYLFGDDDTDAAEYDGTISGLSYNNTIAGQVSDNGLLTLDTSKCFFNSYDYNNLIPTVKDIPVEFGITVDASMKPTAITESSTGDYSVDDMKDDSFNGAKVHARFAFETSQGGMTVTVLSYLEGVLNNSKTEITVGETVISTEIIPTMVFHKSNEVWTVWYDNTHSSWKITVNQ